MKRAGKLAFIIGVFLAAGSGLVSPGWAGHWPESAMADAYAEGGAAPYAPFGGTVPEDAACTGTATVLEIHQARAKMPQHDVDLGRTEFVLRAQAGGKILCREKFSELWECLEFNPRIRKYLLASKNEHGVKVTLRGLVYLDEQTSAFQDTVFARNGFEAVASLASPDLHYLALIGMTNQRERAGLYALDLDRDQIQFLGDPPAPPPLSADDVTFYAHEQAVNLGAKDSGRGKMIDGLPEEAVEMMGPWEAPERHYTDLEPGVWAFSAPAVLQVSFGKDSLKQRARARTQKTWNLEKYFRAKSPAAGDKPGR